MNGYKSVPIAFCQSALKFAVSVVPVLFAGVGIWSGLPERKVVKIAILSKIRVVGDEVP